MAVGTSECKEGRLTLLELGPNDEWSQDLTGGSTPLTTMQDALSLTFTPPSAGDYWILANAGVGNLNVTKYMDVQLYNSGSAVAYGYERRKFETADDIAPWFMKIKQTLAASSQTFIIQYLAQSGSTAVINNLTLAALRLDHFRNHADTFYAEALGDSSNSSDTTYADKASLTYTPRNEHHLILSRMQIARASSTANADSKAIQDSTDLVYNQTRQQSGLPDWTIVGMNKSLLTQASTVWKTQFKKSDSALGSAVAGDSTISVLDLSDRRIL